MSRSKFTRIVILLVCIYLILTSVQGIADLLKAGEKITGRERELSQLQAQNRQLLRQKKELESLAYLEGVAYDKLNMARPGEQVIVVPKELLEENVVPKTRDNTPNWKKWVNLLIL